MHPVFIIIVMVVDASEYEKLWSAYIFSLRKVVVFLHFGCLMPKPFPLQNKQLLHRR